MSSTAATGRSPDLTGHALEGRYELYAVIGEGSFGRVYRGLDRRLARPVAVKVIKPWWSEDPEWVRRFEREAQLTARVNDPHIVQIFDVGDAEEGHYYVAELVDGHSVAERVRRGPLEASKARDIAQQLSRALGSAHAKRVVHGDIKPANVLISSRGLVKVTDFGTARLLTGSEMTGTIAGTPSYMAPEQARGGGTSPASDVYSIGVVLYEMLARRPPFSGASAVELALCHLQDPPPPLPSTIPEALAAVVERALAKDPARRFRNGGEMADALACAGEASRSSPVMVDRSGANAVDRRPAPRGPTGTLVASWTSRRRLANPMRRRATLVSFSAVLVVLLGLVSGAILIGKAPQVRVPRIVGFSSSDARSSLRQLGLGSKVHEVPAPGATTGTVTGQAPSPGVTLARGSAVSLSVAEAPRWRAVIAFGGQTSRTFRIRGTRWRIVYRMSYNGTCTFIFFCMGPTAHVASLNHDNPLSTFDLNRGSDQIRTFHSGPGVYQVKISPGDDSSHWSAQIGDYY